MGNSYPGVWVDNKTCTQALSTDPSEKQMAMSDIKRFYPDAKEREEVVALILRLPGVTPSQAEAIKKCAAEAEAIKKLAAENA